MGTRTADGGRVAALWGRYGRDFWLFLITLVVALAMVDYSRNQVVNGCRLAEAKARIVVYLDAIDVEFQARTPQGRVAAARLLDDYREGVLDLTRRYGGCSTYDVQVGPDRTP